MKARIHVEIQFFLDLINYKSFTINYLNKKFKKYISLIQIYRVTKKEVFKYLYLNTKEYFVIF